MWFQDPSNGLDARKRQENNDLCLRHRIIVVDGSRATSTKREQKSDCVFPGCVLLFVMRFNQPAFVVYILSAYFGYVVIILNDWVRECKPDWVSGWCRRMQCISLSTSFCRWCHSALHCPAEPRRRRRQRCRSIENATKYRIAHAQEVSLHSLNARISHGMSEENQTKNIECSALLHFIR